MATSEPVPELPSAGGAPDCGESSASAARTGGGGEAGERVPTPDAGDGESIKTGARTGGLQNHPAAASEDKAAPAAAPLGKAGGEHETEEPCTTGSARAKNTIRTCGGEGHPTVTGAEAAKGGRGGAVGATVLWLVCDCVTKAVARLERQNGVAVLQAWVDRSEKARELLFASHRAYEAFVLGYLPATEAASFDSMHLQEGPNRRHGNPGVSVPDRVKCLHAHTATYLSGIPNPIGHVTVHALLSASSLADSVDMEALLQASIAWFESLPPGSPLAVSDESAGELCRQCAELSSTFSRNKKSRKRRLH
ncbi:hypothetical protein DIPPA_07323 [Diplonema papillatum]|nr:hypothetical protein DIPPA_07323 [Diplonema papillatum]